MRDPSLGEAEREMLGMVEARIHHDDGMYSGDGASYFAAGLSAVACVDEALERAGELRVREVLDLPSGYGRELRFLALRFPEAKFTACDIQPKAADFCAATFGAASVHSRQNPSEVEFAGKFDLIWCGSLFTHLDAETILGFLRLFARSLNACGLLVFTTNGNYVAEKMRREGATYDLCPEDVPPLVSSYEREGYAYCDYQRGLGYFNFHPKKSGYGVSITSPDLIRRLAREAGELEEIYFKPRGWCEHQDVFGLRKLV